MHRRTLESEAGLKAKAKTVPKGPTDKERALHDLTHSPARAWCKACVQGKAIDDPHRALDQTDTTGLPVAGFAHGEMEFEKGDEDKLPLFALVDFS